jgi:hypothetical protein
MHLRDLFNKYGTDKDRNGYTPYYDTIFKNIRHNSINFLELGIGTLIESAPSSMLNYCLEGYKQGGSLRAWRDYFDKGTIYGFDLQPDTQFTEERISTGLGDSCNKDDLDKFLNDTTFDVILDDGSHYDEYQVKTLKNLWHRVNPMGFYIIEDIQPWSRISTDFFDDIKQFVGTGAYLYFSEKKNILIISKMEE